METIGLGTMLAGRYELVAAVADGAMGCVYEAVDRAEGGKVAVKVLHAEHLTDDAMRRRLRREGAVLKALDHPAIDAGDCLPIDAVADVPSAVAEFVRRAMHHDKRNRYASITELERAWREARGT